VSHDHRDRFRAWIFFDAPQHLQPIHLGKVHIEKNDFWLAPNRLPGMRAFTEENIQCLLAVTGRLNVVGQVCLSQGAQSQVEILLVILDNQYVDNV
jgi:hypothetical protein